LAVTVEFPVAFAYSCLDSRNVESLVGSSHAGHGGAGFGNVVGAKRIGQPPGVAQSALGNGARQGPELGVLPGPELRTRPDHGRLGRVKSDALVRAFTSRAASSPGL
jgi:hypothetical protein